MISELERLLEEAGYRCPAGRDLREYILVKRNAGSIPVVPDGPAGYVGRGFQIVLLNRRGKPSHYARCRWAGDAFFARECAYVTALSEDPELRGLLPRFRTACSSTIRVLVSEYLTGNTHLDRLQKESASEWLRTAAAATDLRDRITERARVTLPGLNKRLAEAIPSRTAADSLEVMRQAGVPRRDVDALTNAIGPLERCPRHIQHGDFWPGNLVRHRKSWWLIDYEEFATVFVPFYDLFHYVQQTARVRAWGGSGEWLGHGVSAMPRPWRRVFGALIGRQTERLGFSQEQIVAALAFYVIRMGSHRLRPGVPREFAEPLLSDARTIARWVHESGAVEDLLPWTDER